MALRKLNSGFAVCFPLCVFAGEIIPLIVKVLTQWIPVYQHDKTPLLIERDS